MMRWSMLLACAAGSTLAASAAGQQLPLHVRAVNAAAAPGGNGTSWAAAFHDLRAALNAAAASGGLITELWIAQGEYSAVESPGNCIPFVVSNVSLYGGFHGFETSRDQRPAGAVSTVKADGTCDYYTFHQVLAVNTVGPVVIDSILITQANGGISVQGPTTITNVEVRVPTRAALVKGGSAMLVVRHCRFDNSPSSSGPVHVAGPAIIEDSVLRAAHEQYGFITLNGVTVRNSSLRANFGMGGHALQVTSSLIEDCAVSGGGTSTPLFLTSSTFRRSSLNATSFTAQALVSEDCHFEDCTLAGERYDVKGGTIRRTSVDVGYSPYSITLRDVTVVDSQIRTGYPVWVVGMSRFVNTRIEGGADIRAPSGSTSAPRFINCLLQLSPSYGGRIAVQPGWQFSNCIFWGSAQTEAEIFNVPAGLTGFVNHSIVRGWTGQYGGAGNSGVDPMLDEEGRPLPGSPAIDAGDNSAYPINQFPYDLAGNCRIVAATAGGLPRIDIGPYEFPACLANCDCSTAAPLLNIFDLVCFLQRFSAGDPWANCDQSTTPPVLNVSDFNCFLQQFAQGCP
jgi:hypothetical protein